MFYFDPNDRCFRFCLLRSSWNSLADKDVTLQIYLGANCTTDPVEVPLHEKSAVNVEQTFKEPLLVPTALCRDLQVTHQCIFILTFNGNLAIIGSRHFCQIILKEPDRMAVSVFEYGFAFTFQVINAWLSDASESKLL